MAESQYAYAAPGADQAEDRAIQDKLRYASSPHQRIVTRIRQRRELAEREIRRRYDDWNRVDEHLQMYIDLSRNARRGDRSTDPNEKEIPFERSVVVPVSYAILQVRLTAVMAIFMARMPMIQLRGRGPEDIAAAKLMESVLAYDLEETQAILALYAAFQSAEKYGIGILSDSWEREHGWVTSRIKIPGMPDEMVQQWGQMLGIPAIERVWGLQREYNRIRPVDPFYYWPDPRVRGHEVQEMEFIGDRVFRGFSHISARSIENGGYYFNLEAARRLSREGREARRGLMQSREISAREGIGERADDIDRGVYALDQFQINVVPKEWDLGPGTRVEKWRFTLLDDQVIIRAHREPYQHESFCYSVMQPNYDAFSVFTNGVIEDLDGLQRLTNWLFNSHRENIQRVLNDSFIYDPFLVEEDDLLNPGPARHIRTTEVASELIRRGILNPQQLITQLPVTDVTRSHLQEMDNIFDMAQRMSGVNDPAMGQPLPGRRTLGEVENVIFSSSRRMALSAQLYDMQGITPLAKRMVANRQQFMSEEQFFSIAGEGMNPQALQQVLVNRDQILGNFNYVPVSGVTPPDPARHAETWMQALQMIGQLPPPIAMQFDFFRIFLEIAKNMGIKDIESFRLNTQVMPDQQVVEGVGAGTLAPAGGTVPPAY